MYAAQAGVTTTAASRHAENSTCVDEERRPLIDRTIGGLERLIDRAERATQVVGAFADRTTGSQPPTPQNIATDGESPESCRADALDRRVSQLSSALSVLEMHVARLQGI